MSTLEFGDDVESPSEGTGELALTPRDAEKIRRMDDERRLQLDRWIKLEDGGRNKVTVKCIRCGRDHQVGSLARTKRCASCARQVLREQERESRARQIIARKERREQETA